MGPGSAMSTAPKELRKVDLSAKMSKSKKKKLKKREKRNQALMEEAMQHVMETEPMSSRLDYTIFNLFSNTTVDTNLMIKMTARNSTKSYLVATLNIAVRRI